MKALLCSISAILTNAIKGQDDDGHPWLAGRQAGRQAVRQFDVAVGAT